MYCESLRRDMIFVIDESDFCVVFIPRPFQHRYIVLLVKTRQVKDEDVTRSIICEYHF